MTYATESGHKIWNLQCQSLYRSGSLKTVAGGLTKCKLDLVGFQKVKWDGVVHCTFLCADGNANYELGTLCVSTHERMILAVKWVEFFSGRVLYIILSGHWCDTVVFNSPTEDKSDDG
jgi:hypothetical protein